MAVAQQKRMAFKEQVTFYRDDHAGPGRCSPSRPARSWTWTPGTTYATQRGAAARLLPQGLRQPACCARRSTSRAPGYAGTGQERSQLVAILRRFVDIPFLPFHFDFADARGPVADERGAAGVACATATSCTSRTRAWTSASPPRVAVGSGRADGALEPMVLYPAGPRAPSRRRRPERPVCDRRATTSPPPATPAPGAGARRAAARTVAEVVDLDADGVPCRLYRPAGADPAARRAPARRRLRLPRRRRARRGRAGGSPTGSGWRCSASTTGWPPEHRFPAAPDDVDTVLALARPRGAELGLGRADVRPRRQRRRQPRAGGRAAAPRAVPGGGAALPVPRPDGAGFESYRTGAPTASTRARRRGTGSSTPRADADLDPPRPRAAAAPTGSARCRRRWSSPPSTTRCATRASTSPRCSPRRASRWSAPATSARSTASGGTPASSPPPSR